MSMPREWRMVMNRFVGLPFVSLFLVRGVKFGCKVLFQGIVQKCNQQRN